MFLELIAYIRFLLSSLMVGTSSLRVSPVRPAAKYVKIVLVLIFIA